MAVDNRIPLSAVNVATSFNGAKAVVAVPDACTQLQVIATGVDVWVALRDTNTNTSDDGRNAVNLDTSPETKAVLVVAAGANPGIPVELAVPSGKRTTRSGTGPVYPEARARMRGFLHYKPTGASGTGRLIVNFFQ
jgi:hypothetical protein